MWVGVCLHASWYMYMSTSQCAVMCPLRVCVCLLVQAFASIQFGIREIVMTYFQMCGCCMLKIAERKSLFVCVLVSVCMKEKETEK